jgi:hypothetical protein
MSWLRRPYPVLKEVIVNMRGDRTAFRGVVWDRRDGYLVLRNARQLLDAGKAVDRAVAGEVLVPLDNVEFLQVVT